MHHVFLIFFLPLAFLPSLLIFILVPFILFLLLVSYLRTSYKKSRNYHRRSRGREEPRTYLQGTCSSLLPGRGEGGWRPTLGHP